MGRLLSILPADTPVDWDVLGWLLRGWDEQDRRRFAGDYFAERRRRERAASKEGAHA